MIQASYEDKAAVYIFLEDACYHKNKQWSNNNLPIIQLDCCYRKIVEDNT